MADAPAQRPLLALTVDVEDYFMVSAMEPVVRREAWGDYPSRVAANTDRLLDLFARHGVQATFFVLGWLAERQPELVRRIAAAGHELGSHGWSHRLVYDQGPAEFEAETRRTRELLAALTGQPIHGYRAASYSITARSLWALPILRRAGHRYDSSIFPVHHDRYGIPGAARLPFAIEAAGAEGLYEFPLSTWRAGPLNLPIAGGGYFRIFPYWLTRCGLRSLVGRGEPAIFYVHPWEVDPGQPRLDPGRLGRFRHYHHLDLTVGRLARLLGDFAAAPAAAVLESWLGIRLDSNPGSWGDGGNRPPASQKGQSDGLAKEKGPAGP